MLLLMEVSSHNALKAESTCRPCAQKNDDFSASFAHFHPFTSAKILEMVMQGE